MVGAVAQKDFVKDPGLHRTMLGDGLACLAASFFGGPPVTTYSEVTGAMSIYENHPTASNSYFSGYGYCFFCNWKA